MLSQSILVGLRGNDAGICAVTRQASRRMTCINLLPLRTRLPIRCQISRQADYLADARPRRWCGSLAVQEAAMCRRLVLITSMSLSLAACVPYYDGGSSYYRSDIYSSPAPVYYGGGSYYSYPRSYYSQPSRYYPSARYYQAAPRYYQPSPRYYQAPSRAYRPTPSHGWDGHRNQGWGNNYGQSNQRWEQGGRGGRDHADRRGDRRGDRHGEHNGRGERGGRNR